MKAIVLIAYGDVDNLELRDLPEPSAGPDEIKVRMAGASINPVDTAPVAREARTLAEAHSGGKVILIGTPTT